MDFRKIINDINSGNYFGDINLHVHSNYSDGIEDFDKLIEQGEKINLKYMSITDHNTVEGYKNSKYKNSSILIPGVEFDCFMELCPIHILGYGIDIYNDELNKLCSNEKNDFLRILKSRNVKQVIDVIHKAGGVAILAHPCCYWVVGLERFIKRLKKMGLDGVETSYPYDRFRKIVKFHSRKRAFEIAEKLDLLQTKGSDCHTSLT